METGTATRAGTGTGLGMIRKMGPLAIMRAYVCTFAYGSCTGPFPCGMEQNHSISLSSFSLILNISLAMIHELH